MALADLHIHSVASDGTLTPREIAQAAKNRGVGLISVCDHNTVRSNAEMAVEARAQGLDYIEGCEIDGFFEDTDIHILCYGADFTNDALLECIRHTRRCLDDMSPALLGRMMKDYPQLGFDSYEAFEHDTKLGGWKMLQYLRANGVTRTLHEGFGFYDAYGVTYAGAGFYEVERIIPLVHAAGGRAVLAHPGVTFPSERISALRERIESILPLGFDGVECHYPKHSAGVTRLCEEICRERDLMTTAGSDCHGAFNHNEIGMTNTPVEKLRLKGLR